MPTTLFLNSRISHTTIHLVTPIRIRRNILRPGLRTTIATPRSLRILLSIGPKAPIRLLLLPHFRTTCAHHHIHLSSNGQTSHIWTLAKRTLLAHRRLIMSTMVGPVTKVVHRQLRMTSCLLLSAESVQEFLVPRGRRMAAEALETAPRVSKSARAVRRRKVQNGERAPAGRKSCAMRQPFPASHLQWY